MHKTASENISFNQNSFWKSTFIVGGATLSKWSFQHFSVKKRIKTFSLQKIIFLQPIFRKEIEWTPIKSKAVGEKNLTPSHYCLLFPVLSLTFNSSWNFLMTRSEWHVFIGTYTKDFRKPRFQLEGASIKYLMKTNSQEDPWGYLSWKPSLAPHLQRFLHRLQILKQCSVPTLRERSGRITGCPDVQWQNPHKVVLRIQCARTY